MRTKTDVSAFSLGSAPVFSDSRRALTPNVATASARPLDVDRDRVLSFQQSDAGDGAIWQLTASSTKVESAWHSDDRAASASTLRAGATYLFKQGSTGLAASSKSDGFGTRYGLVSADATSGWQQFTLRSAPGGGYRLVSQADGLCVNLLGSDQSDAATVGNWPCEDPAATNANDAWQLDSVGGDGFTVKNLASNKMLTTVGNGTVGQRAGSPDLAGQQVWHLTEVVQPGGTVPSWSTTASDTPGMPSALVAGDLDRAVNSADHYGDEAAVAYVDDEHRLQVRVIDYNADDSHLTVVAPSTDLPMVGSTDGAGWIPGSVGVAIGNFTGEVANQRANQLAVTWQDDRGIHATFLQYGAEGSTRQLRVVTADTLLVANPDPSTLLLQAGMSHVVAGDFDGDDVDDLAVSYVARVNFGDDDWRATAGVSVSTFTGDGAAGVKIRATTTTRLSDKNLSQPNVGTIWTARGVKLAAGLFTRNDKAGQTIRQRQVVAVFNDWTEAKDRTTDESTWVARLNVATQGDDLQVSSKLSQAGATYNFKGNQTDSFPLTVSAGGFAGVGTNNDIPLWGLAVATRGKSSSSNGTQIMILRPNSDGTFSVGPQVLRVSDAEFRLQAYDQAGKSIVLGAPLVMTSNQYRPTLIAAQPPAHSDWLNGQFVNVSRKSDFVAKLGSGSKTSTSNTQTTKSDASIGVSKSYDSKTTVKTGLFEVGAEVSMEYSKQLKQEMERETATTAKFDKQTDFDSSSTTNDDDLVNGVRLTNNIYRYPILGGALKNSDGSAFTTDTCTPQCYGYYEVIVPTVVPGTKLENTVGRADAYYQPSWQNGNALSYPQLGSNYLVPLPDVNAYSLGGKPQSSQAIGQTHYGLGGASQEATLTFQDSNTSGSERSAKGSLSTSQEVTVGTKVEFHVGTTSASQSFDYSTGVDQASTWGQADTSENTTETSNSFKLEVPQIDSTQGYIVGTAFYVDQAGTQKVVHGVNLTAGSGAEWWKRTYGRKPDLALNLPNATTATEDARGVFRDIKWSALTGRQEIRGFQALQPKDTSNPATSEQPYAENRVAAGDRAKFQVMVHNYSLKASPSARAAFYAVPV
ncbi:MAG: RICIN domain-containing protein, partial [Propionibacteriaceae bacterium]